MPAPLPVVEVEASTLTDEEWLFVHHYRSLQPGASVREKTRFRESRLSLSDNQLQVKLQIAVESFMARGAIIAVTDEHGEQVLSPQTKQPVYTWVGKIISRLVLVNPRN